MSWNIIFCVRVLTCKDDKHAPSLLCRLFGLIRWLSRGKRCWARYYWEVGVGEELRVFEEFVVHV